MLVLFHRDFLRKKLEVSNEGTSPSDKTFSSSNFDLKFSGHSSYHYTYLWTKLQVKIMLFSLLAYAKPYAKTSPLLWKEGVRARVLLGFFIPH